MEEILEKYMIIFFVYAFLGWFMETFGGYLRLKKFVNRGFLIGPYCPIYGIGVCLLTGLLSKYEDDLFVMFFMSLIICGSLEYFTSYIMEKIFKARWWDYHNRKFNINGRICLETLVPFGVAGILFVKVANPFFLKLLNYDWITYVLGILAIIFIVDFVFSFKAILKFRKSAIQIEKEIKDNTEEIANKVKETITEKYEELEKNAKDTAVKIQKAKEQTINKINETKQQTISKIAETTDKFRRDINREKRKRIYANKIMKERILEKSWTTRRLLKAFPNFEVNFKIKKSKKNK